MCDFISINTDENLNNNIFAKVFLPKRFSGLNVLMIGCDKGDIGLECIKRKCNRFIYFDRQSNMQQIKSNLSIVSDILFVNDDLNFDNHKILKQYGHNDIIFYNTLFNSFERDNDKMYDFLEKIVNDVLIYETSYDIDTASFISKMKLKGFEMVVSVDKNTFIIKKVRNLYVNRMKNEIWDHIVSKYYDYIVTENFPFCHTTDSYLLQQYKEAEIQVQKCYDKIKHIKYVAETTFINSVSFRKYYSSTLIEKEKTSEWINSFKIQLIDLVREMNKAGVAHRDMHIKNICIEGDTIKLIDFEFMCENVCDLRNCDDLNGGIYMYVLKNHQLSFLTYLNGQLTMNDFIGSQ